MLEPFVFLQIAEIEQQSGQCEIFMDDARRNTPNNRFPNF